MRIPFSKLVASGNNFILIDSRRRALGVNFSVLSQKVCNIKLGLGADGLLVLERSRRADVKMRIFNPDGSEAEMCGNGARCVAYYIRSRRKEGKKKISIQTRAGLLKAEAHKGKIAINMTTPKNIRLDMPIEINNRVVKVNFINTGVPHAVLLCDGIDYFQVVPLGRLIRHHKRFSPKGANVNFIEPVSLNEIRIRTYERGVEQETLACGTGSVASSIIYFLKLKQAGLVKDGRHKVSAVTYSGESLEITFDNRANCIRNVWLKGRANAICKGEFYA